MQSHTRRIGTMLLARLAAFAPSLRLAALAWRPHPAHPRGCPRTGGALTCGDCSMEHAREWTGFIAASQSAARRERQATHPIASWVHLASPVHRACCCSLLRSLTTVTVLCLTVLAAKRQAGERSSSCLVVARSLDSLATRFHPFAATLARAALVDDPALLITWQHARAVPALLLCSPRALFLSLSTPP